MRKGDRFTIDWDSLIKDVSRSRWVLPTAARKQTVEYLKSQKEEYGQKVFRVRATGRHGAVLYYNVKGGYTSVGSCFVKKVKKKK